MDVQAVVKELLDVGNSHACVFLAVEVVERARPVEVCLSTGLALEVNPLFALIQLFEHPGLKGWQPPLPSLGLALEDGNLLRHML